MTIRRSLALLAGTALGLQSLGSALPMPAAADDDLAGFFYWRLPLTGFAPNDTPPSFGFSMLKADNIWLTPSVRDGGDTDTIVLPPLVDVRFTAGEELKMPSLSLSGIDVGAAIDDALYADTGPAPHTGEWILIGAGIALGGGIACVELCVSHDHHKAPADGGEQPPD